MKYKLIIGITGKYASGKSYVANIFKENNYFEIDVDKLGHQALIEKKNIIIKSFKENIIDSYGNIDRKKLGNIVFNSQKELKKLNSIVHPHMVKETMNVLNQTNYNKYIINAALLMDLELNKLCNKIIFVNTSIENIYLRAKKRDDKTEKQIEFILSNQPSTNQFIKYADYIIDNNYDLITLRNKTINSLIKIEMEFLDGY